LNQPFSSFLTLFKPFFQFPKSFLLQKKKKMARKKKKVDLLDERRIPEKFLKRNDGESASNHFQRVQEIVLPKLVCTFADAAQLGDVQIKGFDGFKFIFSKPITKNFGISHALFLLPNMSNYCFSTYDSLKKGRTLTARVDLDGNLSGSFSFRFRRHLAKIGFQFAPQSEVYFKMNFLKPRTYNAYFGWSNPGSYCFSFMRPVTRHISLGYSFVYDYRRKFLLSAYAAKYQSPTKAFNVLLSPGGIHLIFKRRLEENYTIGTGFLLNPSESGGLESTWFLSTNLKLSTSSYNAGISSDGKVCCVIEENIHQQARFSLSGELDHAKEEYKFGIGFIVQSF